MAKSNPHIGSNFDDLLAEEGLLKDATACAIKRIIAWQFGQVMKAKKITKPEMAKRMRAMLS